jgi:hypothetical protein
MMASDYDKGQWSPLYEGIYGGGPLPSMDQALDTAIAKFWSVDAHGWLGDGRAISAWLVLEDHAKFGYYLSGLAELQKDQAVKWRDRGRGEAKVDLQQMLKAPHNDVIWRMFTSLKRQVIAATETSDGPAQDQPAQKHPQSSPKVQPQPSGDVVAT